ncbi:MAG TPA: hypothetical protein VLH94_02055 [Spirochaetia bacterium]|nr:hypothetical protein [Spirochaetia bacterium]
MKNLFFVAIGLFVVINFFSSINHKSSKNTPIPTPTITTISASEVTDSERETFYKYLEFYRSLPTKQIEDKSNHNTAISLIAKENQISDEKAEQIFQKVSNSEPTTRELEIYNAYDQKLNLAIDKAKTPESIDEDAINKEIAKQFNISVDRLKSIYTHVLATSYK